MDLTEEVLDYARFRRESERKHITAFLVDELGYGINEIELFWSNIYGLVDIDIQEYNK